MKEIFTELYKKVLGFFQTQEKTDASKNLACNRLKLVLMQDRTNLTPYLLERMRGEMIDVLSKYVEMDKEALELNFEQEGDSMALMLSIPVLRAKEEEEIQEMIKAEEEAKAKAAEETGNGEQETEEGLDECHCEEQSDEATQKEAEEETATVIVEDESEKTEITEKEEETEQISTKKKK